MTPYITDDAHGPNWDLYLGDSCERLAEIPDNSVHLSVYSPPFASLFTYTDTPRDLGNSRDRAEFFGHYRFIIDHMLRATMPGRRTCVHVAPLGMTKATHGEMGVYDFRGDVIRAYIDAGWIYDNEVTIDKDPQAQAIRTKSHALMFVTKNRDAAASRPALPDYVLFFRKPGTNPIPVRTGVAETSDDPNADMWKPVTNDEWIQWARPVWYGIRETNTLNVTVARDAGDERHICPLQLDLIERCVRLWSNPGETVLTPFAGIGSEVYTAVKLGRRGVGIELKPSYWRTAVANLRQLDSNMSAAALF